MKLINYIDGEKKMQKINKEKPGTNNWRINILKAICIFTVSFIIFTILNIQIRLLLIIFLSTAAVFCVISGRSPKHTFSNITALIILILFAYVLEHVLIRNNLFENSSISEMWNLINITFVDIILICLIFCFLLIPYMVAVIKKTEDSPQPSLLTDQEYDLERITNYIKDNEIIGINGSWGSGKTFIINEFIRRNETKYEFIVIGLLHSNLDEILDLLLSEIEKIFLKNGLYSSHTRKIKAALDSSGAKEKLISLFLGDNLGYASAFVDMKKDAKEKLKKPIIIIFEDIDRISDTNTIKKVFSLGEQLVNKNIKTIYQYDQNELTKLNFDRTFTEKYIPYVINLTPIKFYKVIEHLYNKIENKTLLLDIKEDFMFLRIPVYSRIPYEILKGQNISIEIDIECISIRKIQQFLNELMQSLKNNNEYTKKENKRVVISFYVFKHFFYPIYEKINIGINMTDALLFLHNDKNYTIFELIAIMRQEPVSSIKNVLLSDVNKDSFGSLCLLNYDLSINEIEHDYTAIINEPHRNLNKKNANEKIDRLIWNLYAGGTSEYTNCEVAVNKMIEMVLRKPESEQSKLYDDF